MRIFITGSEGFIGSHLVEKLLKKGHKVTALVQYNSFNKIGWLENVHNKNLKIIFGDITDEGFIDNVIKRIDVVINLAALISIPYSYRAINSYIKTNIIGSCNVAKAALKNKIKKLIQLSSSEVYGSGKYFPIDEKHELQPQSPYSASKISADAMVMSFFYSFGLNVCLARPFNTYGPRQSLRAIIPTIIFQILKKNKVSLGNINSYRDFSHVSDTCDGIISLINSKNTAGEVFNIGSGKTIQIKKLIDKLRRISKKNFLITNDKNKLRPKNSEVSKLHCNNKKIFKLNRFKPKIDFDHGLLETYNWYKNNLDKFNDLVDKKYF